MSSHISVIDRPIEGIFGVAQHGRWLSHRAAELDDLSSTDDDAYDAEDTSSSRKDKKPTSIVPVLCTIGDKLVAMSTSAVYAKIDI